MKQKDKKKSGKSDKKKRWFLFRQIKRNVALVEDSIAGGIEHPITPFNTIPTVPEVIILRILLKISSLAALI